MVSLDGKQLKTIIIRPGGLQDILLQRETQSAWKVRHLDGWRPTNTDTLIRLITAFTQDKIVNFITDAATDLSPYGLDQPLLLLGFKSFNGDTIQIAIGRGAQNPEDQNRKLYARILDRPNIWEISNETLGKIALHPWQWRTSHAWHIPDVDIKKIIIHRITTAIAKGNAYIISRASSCSRLAAYTKSRYKRSAPRSPPPGSDNDNDNVNDNGCGSGLC